MVCWFKSLMSPRSPFNQARSNKTFRRRSNTGRPPPPFPVSLAHAQIPDGATILSAVSIPSQWCPPSIQRIHRSARFTRRQHALSRHHGFRRFMRLLFCPFLLFHLPHQVYALPGSRHGLLVGEQSQDMQRQQNYVTSIAKHLNHNLSNNASGPVITSLSSTHIEAGLKNTPECFIADTDSEGYVIDTGANRVIVNDIRLLRDISMHKGSIKGVNGAPTTSTAIGTHVPFHLQSDCGHVHSFPNIPAVYVPKCPYNIFPPHLFVKHLKQHNYQVNQFHHDDVNYVFRYKPPCSKTFLTKTIPLSSNDLFIFRTNDGYSSFFSRASQYQPSWTNFPGSDFSSTHKKREIQCTCCASTWLSPGIGINHRENPSTVVLSSPEKQRETVIITPENQQETVEKQREAIEAEKQREVVTPEKQRESSGVDRKDSTPTIKKKVSDKVLKRSPVASNFKTATEADVPAEDRNIALLRRKQLRLLTIHEKLGHISFSILKLMARCNIIPRELADVPPPVCPGCAYGKAHRRKKRHKGARNKKKLREANAPGDVVSIDQLVSPTPGFVPIHRGLPTRKRYVGATIFVDHCSDLTYIHLMTTLDAEATVEAKQCFERFAMDHGVTVKHYHADNGLFDTKSFKQSIQRAKQTLSFCGVNAHHQNGKAERRIRDVTEGARTALLHAAHRWPQAISSSLWPAALKHYVHIKNQIPTRYSPKNGKMSERYDQSPMSRFTGIEQELRVEDIHPFGCPVYVLDNKLQAQQSINKWADRSKVGIYLTPSPNHSTKVPLILNTQTANVTPQFHCIYDDEFATCRRDAQFKSLWQQKGRVSARVPSSTPSMDHSILNLRNHPVDVDSKNISQRFVHSWETPLQQPIDEEDSTKDDSTKQVVDKETTSDRVSLTNSPDRTRYGRKVKPPERYDPSQSMCAFISTFNPETRTEEQLLQSSHMHHSEVHPLASACQHMFSLIATDPDTMTLTEALEEPDKEHFIEAMTKELMDHIKRGHWKVVPLESVPSHKRAIPMVWAMKRKRNPLGEVTRYKARLCAGGHRSIPFVDYWSTYSPVVSWNTIRLVFTLAIINQWHIRSIDFVLAYPQADIGTDIYMRPPKVPADFTIPDLSKYTDRFKKVYKLVKNLYGLKDAGRTWNLHLHQGLVKRSWKQLSSDECLYVKDGMLLIIYVDDACIICPDNAKIDQEIKSLQKDYELTDDGELLDYLGTRFDRNSDGSVLLTQPRMVDRIMKLVGFNENHGNITKHDTPATTVLDNDINGSPREQQWHYRSVVGCLSYLQAMVRPDLTFAVQQCSRFCNNPNKEHEEAVKRICRYLLKTRDKGLLLKPDKSRGLECHVDADWAGGWSHRTSHDPASTYSRSGYCITYAGCPLVWKSRLQPIIALSTTEAEYVALSTALRDVIAIIQLLEELKSHGFKIHKTTPKVVCRTFEDNMSCVKIATNHKTRPRTKHLAIRLHHFRSFVLNKTITIEHISTKEQTADIFTKPLPKPQFEKLRQKLMYW